MNLSKGCEHMNFNKVKEKYSERKENKNSIAEQIIESAPIIENSVTVSIDTVDDYRDSYGEQPFNIDEEKIAALSKSIAELGQLEAMIVRESKDMIGHYQLLAGHHRKRALIANDFTECTVKIIDVTDWEAYCIVCETNIHHNGPLPSQLCRIFKRYRQHSTETEESLTASQLAQMYGISREQMYRYIALDNLIPEIQNLVDNELISSNSIKDLRVLEDEQQSVLAEYVEFVGKKVNKSKCSKIIEFLLANYKATRDDVYCFMNAPKGEETKSNYATMQKMTKKEVSEFIYSYLSDFKSPEDIAKFLDMDFKGRKEE